MFVDVGIDFGEHLESMFTDSNSFWWCTGDYGTRVLRILLLIDHF